MDILIAIFAGIGTFLLMAGIKNFFIYNRVFLEKRLEGKEIDEKSEKEKIEIVLGEEKKKKMTFNERIELQIEQSGVKLKIQEYYSMLSVSVFVLFGFGLISFRNPIFACVLAIFGVFIPHFYLKMTYQKRLKKFNGQLVDVLRTMSSSMRGGLSLEQAIENLAENSPNPSNEEFQKVVRDLELGQSMERALSAMRERLGDKDIDLIVTVIFIQRQLGGNLAMILEKIAGTIQDRIKLKQEIKAMTSQGKMSAFLMGGMPIVLFFGINILNPEYLSVLFESQFGLVLLGMVFVLDLIGLAWALKLASPKIQDI
ncbi:MAG: type II secretion system F family protein [bacterium]